MKRSQMGTDQAPDTLGANEGNVLDERRFREILGLRWVATNDLRAECPYGQIS